MSAGVVAEAVTARTLAPRRGWTRLAADLGTILCAVVLLLFVVAAVWPQLLTAQDPLAADRALILSAPSAGHPLGTDEIGRDVYARIVFGARSSLVLGFGAVLISLVFGTVFDGRDLFVYAVTGVILAVTDAGVRSALARRRAAVSAAA